MSLALSWLHSWVLLFLPLALLPLWRRQQPKQIYSWLPLLPEDPLSTIIDWIIRLLAIGSIATLLVSLAGPQIRARSVERIGQGAHIVLLLDRSASMNDNFISRYLGGNAKESKSAIARQLLTEFVEQRPKDLFGMVTFSTAPIYAMPMTQRHEAIKAAIRGAGSGSKGITNIAPALSMALDFFNEQAHTGSRVILLVSDGAARLEPEVQEALRRGFEKNRVMLYWLYLRNHNGKDLNAKSDNANESTSPEYFLHNYFKTLPSGYQAYQVENPTALKQAIADISELENKPIRYQEKIPAEDLSIYCNQLAFTFVLLLLIARLWEVKPWAD